MGAVVFLVVTVDVDPVVVGARAEGASLTAAGPRRGRRPEGGPRSHGLGMAAGARQPDFVLLVVVRPSRCSSQSSAIEADRRWARAEGASLTAAGQLGGRRRAGHPGIQGPRTAAAETGCGGQRRRPEAWTSADGEGERRRLRRQR